MILVLFSFCQKKSLDHTVYKDAPAPKWLTKGVNQVEKGEEQYGYEF